MPIYGSCEWLDAVQEHLNADAGVQAQAKSLSADLQYVIEADPDHGLAETRQVGWRMDGGRCAETWEGMRAADFVFVAPYSVFKRVNTGELSAADAMMKGELQVQGELAELMANMAALGAMQAVLEAMHREGVTEWPG
ncbi:MAG TPA: SCP2 sterol-binding domain-containing protein [Acidimicrobiia bacterium]|nr:SCP2 sterol-binding domain-containing protein [Acidimicrobiia bacterium]